MRHRLNNPAVWFPVLSLLLLAIAFWPRNTEVTEKTSTLIDRTISSSGAARVLCVIGVQVRCYFLSFFLAPRLHTRADFCVGITPCMQTGFTKAGASPQYDYGLRRVALRSSWFPNTRSALEELLQKRGVVVRFIIGHTKIAADEKALAAEEREYGGFLRLPIQVRHGTPVQCQTLNNNGET